MHQMYSTMFRINPSDATYPLLASTLTIPHSASHSLTLLTLQHFSNTRKNPLLLLQCSFLALPTIRGASNACVCSGMSVTAFPSLLRRVQDAPKENKTLKTSRAWRVKAPVDKSRSRAVFPSLSTESTPAPHSNSNRVTSGERWCTPCIALSHDLPCSIGPSTNSALFARLRTHQRRSDGTRTHEES